MVRFHPSAPINVVPSVVVAQLSVKQLERVRFPGSTQRSRHIMEKIKTFNTLKGSVREFKELLGRTLYKVEADSEVLTLYLSKTNYVRFQHNQDCCEHVYIEDICGDLNDLVGAPLVEAEEVSDYEGEATGDESYTWTFYRFRTRKGSVTVRWYGSSNGYYSESVSVDVVDTTVRD